MTTDGRNSLQQRNAKLGEAARLLVTPKPFTSPFLVCRQVDEAYKKSVVSHDIRTKFIQLWPYYLLQSAIALPAFLVIVLLIGDPKKMASITAMGATCFIVFAMPKSDSAQTRNVIGGHFTCLLCGALFYFLIPAPYWLEYPLVVGVAIFFMVALDFEHPPAVGTALAVVTSEINLQVFAIIIFSAMVLSQIRYYSRKFLKDLV